MPRNKSTTSLEPSSLLSLEPSTMTTTMQLLKTLLLRRMKEERAALARRMDD